MFVTADLQTVFHIRCLSSMKQLRTKCHISCPNDTLVTATGQKKKPFAYLPHFNFTFYMNFVSSRAAIISKIWYIYEGWNVNSGNYLFTTDTK